MSVALVRREQNVEVSVKDITSQIQVPNNNYAKLMYYLSCVESCYPGIKALVGARLIDYENYSQLTAAEKSSVVSYAELWHPDKIDAFIEADDLGDSSNKFLAIEVARNQFTAAASVSSSSFLALAVGQRYTVAGEVMVYTRRWIQNYYHGPLQYIRAPVVTQNQVTVTRQTYTYRAPAKRKTPCWHIVIAIVVIGFVIGAVVTLVENKKASKDACLSSPCYNNGTCYNATETSYSCFCPVGYTGSRCSNYIGDFIDCYDYYRNGSRVDGIYSVRPLNSYQSWSVYCEMSTGGWTRIQHRQDGSVNFNRNWQETKVGFGSLWTEHWLGNDAIYYLTYQSTYEMRWSVNYTNGRSVTYSWKYFKVANEASDYRLSVSSAQSSSDGVAVGFQNYHNGALWSTKDRDMDTSSSTHCAASYQGPWWYKACYTSNLNNLYWLGGSCFDQCVADCVCLDDTTYGCSCSNSQIAVTHTTIKIKRTCC